MGYHTRQTQSVAGRHGSERNMEHKSDERAELVLCSDASHRFVPQSMTSCFSDLSKGMTLVHFFTRFHAPCVCQNNSKYF